MLSNQLCLRLPYAFCLRELTPLPGKRVLEHFWKTLTPCLRLNLTLCLRGAYALPGKRGPQIRGQNTYALLTPCLRLRGGTPYALRRYPYVRFQTAFCIKFQCIIHARNTRAPHLCIRE